MINRLKTVLLELFIHQHFLLVNIGCSFDNAYIFSSNSSCFPNTNSFLILPTHLPLIIQSTPQYIHTCSHALPLCQMIYCALTLALQPFCPSACLFLPQLVCVFCLLHLELLASLTAHCLSSYLPCLHSAFEFSLLYQNRYSS